MNLKQTVVLLIGMELTLDPILCHPCQSRQIQCQSQAIYEAICLDNQGTSALYGMVPSLLGG